MTLIVSSTEPASVFAPLRRIFPPDGDVEVAASTGPENRGVDFLWRAHGEWWGIQRKEIKDFIASVQDGRLAKEVGQMQGGVAFPHIVIEGQIRVINGEIATGSRYGRAVTHAAFRAMVWSLMTRGITFGYTPDTAATAEYVAHMYTWSQKDNHSTGMNRPGPDAEWGKATNREYQLHIVMGLPGVGRELAERIVDHFGEVPWKWKVSAKELAQVRGIGTKKAVAMIQAFNVDTDGNAVKTADDSSSQTNQAVIL